MSLMGELRYFLGLQVTQKYDGLFIPQSKYALELIKKFGFENAKDARTPMSSSIKLSKDEHGKPIDPTLFRSMIRSLLYLIVSCPDIMYAVRVCARYQSNPKESHLQCVKQIIKYVKGTLDLKIWNTKDTSSTIIGYTGADWASYSDDSKSTSGACHYIGNNLVGWFSKKQNCTSLSTAESEYMAAGSCFAQLMWIKQMLKDYDINEDKVHLHCDNQSAINISKNLYNTCIQNTSRFDITLYVN